MYVKGKLLYINLQRRDLRCCHVLGHLWPPSLPHTPTDNSPNAVFIFLRYIFYFQPGRPESETRIKLPSVPLALSAHRGCDEGSTLTLTLSPSCFPASTWGAWRCCSRCERWISTPELRSQGEAAHTPGPPRLSALCSSLCPRGRRNCRVVTLKCRPSCAPGTLASYVYLLTLALFFHIRCLLRSLCSFCSGARACVSMYAFPST